MVVVVLVVVVVMVMVVVGIHEGTVMYVEGNLIFSLPSFPLPPPPSPSSSPLPPFISMPLHSSLSLLPSFLPCHAIHYPLPLPTVHPPISTHTGLQGFGGVNPRRAGTGEGVDRGSIPRRAKGCVLS